MPEVRRQPCGKTRPGASGRGGSSAGAAAAASGGRSPRSSSAQRRAAAEVSRISAEAAAPTVRQIDGWLCEDFSGRTGHAIGRSAQLGDLQVCLTLGDRGATVSDLPPPVLVWLLTGQSPPAPPEPDKRQVPFPFAKGESA